MTEQRMNRRPIRALTVRQPWAAAIIDLGKDVENRVWKPPAYMVGSYLAIHAGMTCEADARGRLQDAIRFGTEPELRLPKDYDLVGLQAGAVIGVVRVAGYVHQEAEGAPLDRHGEVPAGWSSPWFTGPCGWVLSEPVRLPRPLPAKGRLGLWQMDDDLLAGVRAGWLEARTA